MTGTATVIKSGEGLTIESIWALFRELAERQAETGIQIKETDALIKQNAKIQEERQAKLDAQLAENARIEAERQTKEAERQTKADAEMEKLRVTVDQTSKTVAETSKKVDQMCKRVDATSKNIDGVNRTLGNWTEEMVRAGLWKKFDKIGYTFTKGGRQLFRNKKNEAITEVDAFLENGEYAIAVEIKSQFMIKDVDDHIEQLKLLRRYMDAHKDKRKLLGGVAGAVVHEDVRRYAYGNGLYVVVQSGDSVALAKAPKGFKPKEW